jgi:flagellar biosynthesis protein FlhF
MQLQRVLAHNTREALDQVHRLYGEDALVISNKKANELTEVIVAVDLIEEAKTSLDEIQVMPEKSVEVVNEEQTDFQSVMNAKIFGDTEHNGIELADMASAPNEAIDSEHLIPEVSEEENFRDQLKAREIVDLVKQELEILRKEFRLAQQLDVWAGTHSVSEEMKPLIEALNETGIPVALRSLVTSSIDVNTTMSEALFEISTALGKGISSLNILDDLTGIHILAGASGAGKTLMAGRLAKQGAVALGEQSVAIISYNDLAFGAWNRVQLVGSQSGVETFRASSPEMLRSLLEELQFRDLIIIDTPGEYPISSVEALTDIVPMAKKHLVMAGDSSEASAKRYFDPVNFNWDSLMLSRLEDHVYPWAAINCLLKGQVPVSVGAVGPSIIDPAMIIDGNSLAHHALSHLPLSFGQCDSKLT